ncbi:MAG: precorrin-4 C(11)-methyltransferase [Deltaproteobacteria bacterium]|nr:precorrin-4 C(11)-methyltransferase [Deltaproteobacteria bacterium]
MARTPKKTLIHFIGAGPGDPELITVKGSRLLKKADIVIYTGSLVKDNILKYCRKGVEAHNSASMHLEEITDMMVKAAKAGKHVARLHTGDPSLYSAMREQADTLDREGVDYEIVPGVSSAFAAIAALKKEFTKPGVTQTVIFTRLEGRTPVPASEGLSSLSSHRASICVFLSAGMIDKVIEELLKGYPPETPAAIVYRATWEDEKKITGTLKDIAAKAKKAGITNHALIMAGEAIGDTHAASLLYDKGFKHGFRK